MDTGVLRSPKRSGRGPYKPVEDFDQTVIRNKIQEFYTVRRQLPTTKSLHEVLKTDVEKKRKKNVTLSGVELMTTRFQKLHITSRLISAYLLQCSQIPINTLFCQFNYLFTNTEMYEGINKLRNYRITYANFIREYGVNFHELYLLHQQAVTAQKSLCMPTISPEPSLLPYTKNRHR